MPKRKDQNVGGNITVERRAQDRIRRLKLIARKLLSELEIIEESSASKELVAIDFYEEVKRFETELIIQALTHSEGHQVKAARLLSMNASTLNAKMKQYGIETNAFSVSEEVKNVQPIPPKLRVLS